MQDSLPAADLPYRTGLFTCLVAQRCFIFNPHLTDLHGAIKIPLFTVGSRLNLRKLDEFIARSLWISVTATRLKIRLSKHFYHTISATHLKDQIMLIEKRNYQSRVSGYSMVESAFDAESQPRSSDTILI